MSDPIQAKKLRDLLNKLSKESSLYTVNELRIILALERIVARLTNNEILDNHLIFKGGFVMLKTLESDRFTRDLDALGFDLDKDKIESLIPMALSMDLNDGFWFGDIKMIPLEEQGEYGALRFDSAYQIGEPDKQKIAKLSRIHFDIGFGDIVPKKIKKIQSASILKNENTISWKVYPPEFIFSEKLQTLVVRSSSNSRAKDIYDMVLLANICTNKSSLKDAIISTFKNRRTELPTSFYEFAINLNLRQIEISWNTVQFANVKQDFKVIWNILMEILNDIDSLINGELKIIKKY
jgi:predicted nucleotidyltransferase component of viral defense system